MLREESFDLFEKGILRKGTRVKMQGLAGYEEFRAIDGACIKRARPGELEDDWVVVIIDGEIIDSSWITDIKEGDLMPQTHHSAFEQGGHDIPFVVKHAYQTCPICNNKDVLSYGITVDDNSRDVCPFHWCACGHKWMTKED